MYDIGVARKNDIANTTEGFFVGGNAHSPNPCQFHA